MFLFIVVGQYRPTLDIRLHVFRTLTVCQKRFMDNDVDKIYVLSLACIVSLGHYPNDYTITRTHRSTLLKTKDL